MEKQINKRKWLITTIIALLLSLTFVISIYSVVQNVASVHNIFFPMEIGFTDREDDTEWSSVHFAEKDYLLFTNIFFNKEITNQLPNERDIILRVKDSEGSIVVNDISIPSGTSVTLKELKRNEKYFFEVTGPAGRYFFTFS